MTNGVDQALPRILMPGTGADRQMSRDAKAGPGFDEALGNALKSRPNADASQAGVDGDGPPLGGRLGAAFGRIENFGRKFEFRLPVRDQAGEADSELADGPAPTADEAAADAETLAHDRRAAKAAEDEREVDPRIDIALAEAPEKPVREEASAARAANAAADQAARAQSAAGGIRPDVTAARSGEAARRAAPAAPAGRTAIDSIKEDAVDDGGNEGDASDGVEPRPRAVQPAASPKSEAAQSGLTPPSGESPRPRFAGAETSSDKPAPKPDSGAADNSRAASRVTVIAEQALPAPAQSTSLSLATTLAASGALKPEAIRIAAEAVPVAGAPAHSLSIQLHPAELGMVTASLKFAGDQLSIELQVESNEAYRALQTDAESLVKSLRGMGYEIDRVTILQPAAASSTQARPDSAGSGGQQFNSGGQQSSAGSSANGGGGASGQHPGGAQSNARQSGQNGPAGSNGRGAGGVYI